MLLSILSAAMFRQIVFFEVSMCKPPGLCRTPHLHRRNINQGKLIKLKSQKHNTTRGFFLQIMKKLILTKMLGALSHVKYTFNQRDLFYIILYYSYYIIMRT